MDMNVRDYLYKVQTENIKLVKMTCDINNEKIDDAISVEIKIATKHEVISDVKGKAFLKAHIIGKNQNSEECLSILVCYEALCRSKLQNFDREEFEFFLKGQSVPMLWGYVRECVHSITSRMGIPPIYLPILNVTDVVSNSLKGNHNKGNLSYE